jgi:hypothetical protein
VKNGDEQCISKTVSKVAVTNKLSLEGAAHQYIAYRPAAGENKFEKIVVDVPAKQTFTQEVCDNGFGCLSNCFKRFLFADLEGFHLRYLRLSGSIGFSAERTQNVHQPIQTLSFVLVIALRGFFLRRVSRRSAALFEGHFQSVQQTR